MSKPLLPRLLRPARRVVVGVALLTGCAEAPLAPPAPEVPSHAIGSETRGKLVTTFCLLLDDAAVDQAPALLTSYGLTLLREYGTGRLLLVEGVPDPVALEADPRVDAVQTDGFTVLSRPVQITQSFFEGFWDEELPAQDAFASMQLAKVHERATGRGVRVAVLDTGVDPTHEFLQSRVELPTTSALGWLDEASGLDTDGDGQFDEGFGHGTHVAGTIAALAPDATILPFRVLDSDGVGSAFELAMGLYEAFEAGADVANLSLVLEGEARVVQVVLREVTDGGMVVVGAAGNQPGASWFPASDSHVLSVAAVDAADHLAGFSANEDVRVAAPGVGVLSAFPGDDSAVASGTSMASAVASGAVAVLTQLTQSAPRAEDVLRLTAQNLYGVELRDGRIDLLRAVQSIPPSKPRPRWVHDANGAGQP